MLIAVDTVSLAAQGRHTGTGVYLKNLLSECLRISERSGRRVCFQGFAPRGERWDGDALASPLFSVRRSWSAAHRRFWLFGGMALAAWRMRPDLVFLPTAQGSVACPRVPVVTTILDVMYARLPAWMLESGRSARWVTWANARLASTILTISSWSKTDLVDIFRLDPESVQVTYLGYEKSLYNDSPADGETSAALLNRLGIQRPFILHHGMVQLRKNLIRLINAWEQVIEGPGKLEAQLVLAGPPGLGYEQIKEAKTASWERDRIILTGALGAADLATLVKNACLCVIPSLYEGFCLPLVEAMACGVPTVASNSSCIPEISGGVLEYFDPLSVEEMAEVTRRALEDSGLRERLRKDGLARASEFSWERCARQTLDIFAKTAANHA